MVHDPMPPVLNPDASDVRFLQRPIQQRLRPQLQILALANFHLDRECLQHAVLPLPAGGYSIV